MPISGRERDAYDEGFDAGARQASRRAWVDLTEEQYAQLLVDYGDDDYTLMQMVAATLREMNE